MFALDEQVKHHGRGEAEAEAEACALLAAAA